MSTDNILRANVLRRRAQELGTTLSHIVRLDARLDAATKQREPPPEADDDARSVTPK
jgi:hypothetical protein